MLRAVKLRIRDAISVSVVSHHQTCENVLTSPKNNIP